MASKRQPVPLNLLALDGGGVRGISELVILHRIMEAIQQMDPHTYTTLPKPCEFFHIIAGVSTGGLVAILLGRLRMSTEEAIAAYHGFAKEIFGEKKTSLRQRYSAAKLQQVIERIVQDRHAGELMLDPEDPEMGRVFVCAMPAANQENPHRMRTYESPKGDGLKGVKIWEAARATSAAPSFFKAMYIQGEVYIDAAIGCNNPTSELLQEAGELFDKSRKLGCLVSLGTGTRKRAFVNAAEGGKSVRSMGRWAIGLVASLKNAATDTEGVDKHMTQHFRNFESTYFRFNVPDAADKVGLPDYEKMDMLEKDTRAYLDSEAERVRKVAEILCTPSSEGLTLEKACYLTLEPLQKAQPEGRLSRAFVGRDDILERMSQVFDERSSPIKDRRREFLLWGMGGVGKTQIALQFRSLRESHYEHALWIDATDSMTIEGSYLRNAPVLGIEVENNSSAKVIQQTLQVLSRSSGSWLLIMDNCADEEDLRPFLPRAGAGNAVGHVIYTSRRNLLGQKLPPAQVAEVKEMEEDDATKLLVKVADLSSESPPCRAIVRAVGCLPLAIDQAGAYIRMKACAPDKYLDDFGKKKQEWLSDPLYEGSTEQNKSVYATFEMSYDALRALAQEKKSRRRSIQARNAQVLLSVACFYYHNDFRPDIVEHAATHRHLPDSQPMSCKGASLEDFVQINEDGETWNASPFEDAVELLKSFSLVTKTEQGGFSMHVLVHSWARDRMREETRDTYAACARMLLCYGMSLEPYNDEAIGMRRLMAPHIIACWEQATIPLSPGLEFEFRCKMAEAFNEMKLWQRAIESWQVAMELLRHHRPSFSEDEETFVEVKKRLAGTYAGKEAWTHAERLWVEIIASQTRTLGPLYLVTLGSHLMLANVLLQQHKCVEAKELLLKLQGWLQDERAHVLCAPALLQRWDLLYQSQVECVRMLLAQVPLRIELQEWAWTRSSEELDQFDARMKESTSIDAELFPFCPVDRQSEARSRLTALLDERNFDAAEDMLGRNMHECSAVHGIFSREMLNQLGLLWTLYKEKKLHLEALACTRVGLVVHKMVHDTVTQTTEWDRNIWLGRQAICYVNLGFHYQALQIQRAVTEFYTSSFPENHSLAVMARADLESVERFVKSMAKGRNSQRFTDQWMKEAWEMTKARIENLGRNWVALDAAWFSDELWEEFEKVNPEDWRLRHIRAEVQPPRLFQPSSMRRSMKQDRRLLV